METEIDSILRTVLASRNITLQQLAEESEVPHETIRNIYYGKIKNP